MGKIKTHKASAKRFSLTGSGKIKMNHNNHRHNLGLKTAKRKRGFVRAQFSARRSHPLTEPLFRSNREQKEIWRIR